MNVKPVILCLLVCFASLQLDAKPVSVETPEKLYLTWQKSVWRSLTGLSRKEQKQYINSATKGMKLHPEYAAGFQLVRGIMSSYHYTNAKPIFKATIAKNAELDLRNVVQHSPRLWNGLALYELANFYTFNNDGVYSQSDIQPLFERAVKLHPNNLLGRIYYANWLQKTGQLELYQSQLQWIESTLEKSNNAGNHFYAIVRGHELLREH